MYSTMCRNLFECLHLKSNRSNYRVNPENYLTPYEMEMVPILINEILKNNKNFFEIVCYRWHQETVHHSDASDMDGNNYISCENFEKEGRCLKSLIFKVSRCLAEKGLIDDECEKRLLLYRQKRNKSGSLASSPTFLRSRSNTKSTKMANFKYSNTFSLLSEDNLVDAGIKEKKRRFSSNRSVSFTIPSPSSLDLLFIQMGEVLIKQFQASISVKEGHVDDREMKTLIWKHFVQMLVICLTDYRNT